MKYELRDYQARDKDRIRRAFAMDRNVLYVAGTGSGKTVTAASIIEDAVARGNGVWFMAHRRELVEQTSEELHENGIRNGVLMAGHRYRAGEDVQVGSVDTIRERLVKGGNLVVPRDPRLIIFDEAHRSLSRTYRQIRSHFADAYLLGLTATPVLSSGLGMGHAYGQMVLAPSMRELIAAGHLVKPRHFAAATPDLTGIPVQNYDYHQRQLQERYNNAHLRGDVVEQWLRHSQRRKSVVFTTGLKHNKALEKDFLEAGVRAVAVDGRTIKSERSDVFRRFKETDEYEVLINCNLIVEGYDVPEVGCVSIATATKSIGRYRQMGGRCLRPHKPSAKIDCILIDHGGNVERHGFIDDDIPWSLDTNGKIQDKVAEQRDHEPKEFTCDMCGHVFSGRIRCPECGHRLEVKGVHELITSPEELVQITRRGVEDPMDWTDAMKNRFYAQLKGRVIAQGKKEGMAFHMYKERFGEKPKGNPSPEEPGPEAIAFYNNRMAHAAIKRRYER